MHSIESDMNKTIAFSLRELTEIIIKHKNIHEGKYNLSFEFQIAVGAIGPSPESIFPGAMFGVSGVGIKKPEIENIHTVDAAEVNPLPKRRAKKTTVI